MKQNYYSPNEFDAATDSQRIQAAIDKAAAEGCNKVVIPRYNAKRDSYVWIIDKTILLPSDMSIVLDDSYLVMDDNVICHMFRNQNAFTKIGETIDGEQENIRIIGLGNATICGGNLNTLTERTSNVNGRPRIHDNLLICLYNVTDFTLSGFQIVNQRWWAIMLLYARNGEISNLRFKLEKRNSYDDWHNQDGIDLRIGCSNINIENISGETGDDMIALTALMSKTSFEYQHQIEGRDIDIHDVVIRNIRGYCNMCAMIRLLNHYGSKIYNIAISDVFETGRPMLDSKVQRTIRLGDLYYKEASDKAKPGDMYNISIHNIHSRSISALHMEATVKNLHVSNIYVHHDGQHAVTCGSFSGPDYAFIFIPERWEEQRQKHIVPAESGQGIDGENILIENIYYTADSHPDDFQPAVCAFNYARVKNMVIRNINCDPERQVAAFYHENTEDEIKIIV